MTAQRRRALEHAHVITCPLSVFGPNVLHTLHRLKHARPFELARRVCRTAVPDGRQHQGALSAPLHDEPTPALYSRLRVNMYTGPHVTEPLQNPGARLYIYIVMMISVVTQAYGMSDGGWHHTAVLLPVPSGVQHRRVRPTTGCAGIHDSSSMGPRH